MMGNEYILEVKNINKSFGPTHANKNINLSLKQGEVRGLAGENGSGKSTLVSIIAGIHLFDSGEIHLNGQVYQPQNPVDAQKKGIGIVVQELGLVNNLEFCENIFLGRNEQFSKFGFVNKGLQQKAAKELLEKWHLDQVPPRGIAGAYPVGTQKLAELGRAFSTDPNILILDEVTQALSHNNRELLYRIIEEYKSQGKSILIISHDLEEMLRITDSITVLRDGEVVNTVESASTTPSDLKRMMVGREVSGDYYRTDTKASFSDEVVLEVKNLTTESKSVEDVSFELHKGEILAVCGLSDGGIHELGKALLGFEKHSAGHVLITEKNVKVTNPVQAIANGMAYVPKDRDSEAMMLGTTIKENFCLPSVADVEKKLGYLSERDLNKITAEAIESFDVVCVGPEQSISDLSGGNKQKINLGRWTVKGANIYILDCPTRGVDVGVKAYIYKVLQKIKAENGAIIMISDELPEAIGMADRILIMSNGRTSGIVSRSDNPTEETMIEVMI